MTEMNPEANVKVRVENLTFSYPRQAQPIPIIEDLNLDIYDREFVTIVGASGCGKSTLLNIIAGLLPPDKGQVLVDGKPITGPSPKQTMIFQDDAVFPWYTVFQNVEYGLRIAGVDRKERHKIAQRYVELVGLADSANLYPRQLSGGMRKRVDIARALAIQPSVLLMDEPFAALDVLTKQRLQEEFIQIWSANQMTALFVTHDLEEALFLGDRVVVMSAFPGRVRTIVKVPFPRPRDPEIKTKPVFQELRRELAQLLNRKSL